MKTSRFSTFCLVAGATAALLAISPAAGADYQSALDEFQSGDYQQAATAFQELVVQSPSYDFGHYMLGLCQLKLGDFEAAAASLRRAIEFNRDRFEYFHGLAQALHRSGDYDGVIETLNEAAALVGEQTRLPFHSARGLARTALGSWQEAVDDLEIAHRIDPRQISATEGLALAYFKLGRFEDALPLLREAVREDGGRASNHELLAESLLLLHREEEEAFEAAAAYRKLRPDDSSALDLFGRAALAAGRFGEAVAAFSSLLVAEPGSCSARINLALALLASERPEEAERTAAAATECGPLQSDLHATLGMIQRTQGRYEEALASYEKAYAILPASSSYQAIQELRHNIEVREFNLAAEREDEEGRQQRREMEAKIERWNQFVEQN